MAALANGLFRRAPAEVPVTKPLDQHQVEIEENLNSWTNKPLLREIYHSFYKKIVAAFNPHAKGLVVEIGSGIGNLKEHFPGALATDLFPNPWLDLVCDGYELPFSDKSLSHLILFDVFHHLEAPVAFIKEAARALGRGGRLIIFDPCISLASFPAYGLFHHEPVAWGADIDLRAALPRPRKYYAAQGNATRLFFRTDPARWVGSGWKVAQRDSFASFAYLFSGGFSKPALYPAALLPALRGLDRLLTPLGPLFAARCLVVLERTDSPPVSN
jgi:SAM-dependent methyltransferase